MTEQELFVDMPCEPRIHIPKVSLISKEPANPVIETHTHRDLFILKKLGEAKFPVYLVNCERQAKNYAMKIFPLADSRTKARKCFQNETRFSSFNHPNIIKTVHFECIEGSSSSHPHNSSTSSGNSSSDSGKNFKAVAYILMEYAPYGDFSNFIVRKKQYFNEKLVRTYFRQLIEGLEYLHNRGTVHLDIKPDNLLVGEDFSLKIVDFDLSASKGQLNHFAKGTKFYRAPEVMRSEYKVSAAADIYSAGVMLFLLQSGGILPHSEEIDCNGVNLFTMLSQNNEEFWNTHCSIQKKRTTLFDEDFKELFNSMMRVEPRERATIQDIKKAKWYNGCVYTAGELRKIMQTFMRY